MKRRKRKERLEDLLPFLGQLADYPECPNCGEVRSWQIFLEHKEFCEHCFFDYLEILIAEEYGIEIVAYFPIILAP